MFVAEHFCKKKFLINCLDNNNKKICITKIRTCMLACQINSYWHLYGLVSRLFLLHWMTWVFLRFHKYSQNINNVRTINYKITITIVNHSNSFVDAFGYGVVVDTVDLPYFLLIIYIMHIVLISTGIGLNSVQK